MPVKTSRMQDIVVELPHTPGGAPIFVIKVPELRPGVPAPCRMVFATIERGALVGAKPVLITNLLFSINPDLPDQERVIMITTPNSEMPPVLVGHETYLGSHLHPQHGFPISAWELPSQDELDKIMDEHQANAPSGGLDVLAALQNNQTNQEQEGEGNERTEE